MNAFIVATLITNTQFTDTVKTLEKLDQQEQEHREVFNLATCIYHHERNGMNPDGAARMCYGLKKLADKGEIDY
jgi:hypothetical protein